MYLIISGVNICFQLKESCEGGIKGLIGAMGTVVFFVVSFYFVSFCVVSFLSVSFGYIGCVLFGSEGSLCSFPPHVSDSQNSQLQSYLLEHKVPLVKLLLQNPLMH
jgi:hypothetical protein